jgi:periplasmic protein CpxP/Spy
MLKHCLLALMLGGVLYAASALAMAQDAPNQDAPQTNQQSQMAGPNGHRHFDPQRRTEMLTKRLNLTSDQQAKVLDIFKSEQSQMESLRSDSSLSQDDRHSKMMDIHKTSDDQIRALLTPDQQKKFDAMQNRQWQGHHQEGDQGPGGSEQK